MTDTRRTIGAQQNIKFLAHQEPVMMPANYQPKPGHIPGVINTSGKKPPNRNHRSHHPLVYVSKEDRMAAFALRKKLRQSDRMAVVLKKHSKFTKEHVMKELDITESAARSALKSWQESGLAEPTGEVTETGAQYWRKK